MTAIKPTAARDLRYGRRGGRWADNAAGPDLTAWITDERARNQHLDRTDPLKPRILDDGTEIPQKRWPDRHDHTARLRPTSPAEWEGAARMARARVVAGIPLNALDREALDRCPTPPSGLLG